MYPAEDAEDGDEAEEEVQEVRRRAEHGKRESHIKLSALHPRSLKDW